MSNINDILIVDDSETNVLLLQGLLEEEGYNIEYAYSGKEALEMINKKTFDMILLDIMMPGIDGFEILQKVKEEHTTKHTHIIMVTAKDDEENQRKAQEMGANDYVTKPINLGKLKNLIQAYS